MFSFGDGYSNLSTLFFPLQFEFEFDLNLNSCFVRNLRSCTVSTEHRTASGILRACVLLLHYYIINVYERSTIK